VRTLRRPMFRIGGSAGEGITSGLTPRQGYQGTGDASDQLAGDWLRTATMGDIKKFAQESRYRPRGTNVYDFLTEFGLDIASRPPEGGIIATAASAAKKPYERFISRKGEAEAAGYVSEADMFKTLIGAQAKVLGSEGGGKTYAQLEIASRLRNLTETVYNNREELAGLQPGPKTDARIAELKKAIRLDQSEINNLRKTNPYVTTLLKSESYTQPLLDYITDRLKRKKDASGNLVYSPDPKGQEKLLIDAGIELKNILEGLSTGGRVGYANAGPVMGQGMPTQMPTTEDAMPEELGGITYEELRARLPQEVSDEVVRLLANSPEALEDFATIQTEQDIANFNKKYGVNLVLPAEA